MPKPARRAEEKRGRRSMRRRGGRRAGSEASEEGRPTGTRRSHGRGGEVELMAAGAGPREERRRSSRPFRYASDAATALEAPAAWRNVAKAAGDRPGRTALPARPPHHDGSGTRAPPWSLASPPSPWEGRARSPAPVRGGTARPSSPMRGGGRAPHCRASAGGSGGQGGRCGRKQWKGAWTQ